jgi:hypothetical protein
MSEPVLLPPFLPDLIDASDSGFPVRITGRCKRKLFWHIAKMDPYFGPALRITKPGDAACPTVVHCDDAEIAPDTHQVSTFARVKVGVPWDQVEKLQGWVLDIRTFPPGRPFLLMVLGQQGDDDFPASMQLDIERLRQVQPDLFHVPGAISRSVAVLLRFTSQFGSGLAPDGWIDRLFGTHDPDCQAEAMETLAMRLWHFHVEPVIVLDADRGQLAAYSSSTDAVMLLALEPPRGAEWLNRGIPLANGQRFLAIFGFDRTENPSGDLVPGPFSICEFNEGWPVLVDLLVSDMQGLARAKAGIPKHFWERCEELGRQWLAAGYPPRDARPWYSRISIRQQREGGLNRVPGGYWH